MKNKIRMNFVPLLLCIGLQFTHSLSSDQCTPGTKSQILRLLTLLPNRHSRRCSAAAAANADYTQVLAAMKLAIEHINSSNLLPCHTLELLHKESGCDEVTETAVGLASGLFPSINESQENKQVVGIIGPTDILDSVFVSSITNRPHLRTVVLHGAGSSILANRTVFPNSLGILGSVQSLVDLSMALMKKSRWHNIAVLYESSNWFYRTLKEQFIASIGNTSILYISGVTPNFYPIHDIPTSKARIVFLFVSPKHSRKIMCLAYYTNIVYPSYQWILMGQQLTNIVDKYAKVNYQGAEITCSPTTLSTVALEKVFTVNYQSSMTDVHNKHTFTNLSLSEFQDLYHDRVAVYNYTNDELINWDYIMYDAVWTWAVILDKLLASKEHQTFTYTNKQWIKEILEELYSVDFQGVSGHISFNTSNGFLNRQVNLFFVSGGTENHVATYTNNGTIVTDSLQNTETVSDIITIVGLPHKSIVGFFLTITCTVFVAVTLLHTLTLLYRHSQHIKATSPKLIQVAFLGEYIFIMAMLLYNIQRIKVYSSREGTIICQLLWVWSLPLCFTLKMGIVIVRTWRIYRIFKHYLNPGRFISNSALLTILLILVTIDILYAVIWTAVDPMHLEFVEYVVKNGPTNELFVDQSCVAKYRYAWLGIGFTYKIILLVVMIVLSILTRNIPNRTFATTSLRVFAYLFSAVFIVGFCVYYFFLLFNPSAHASIADYIALCVVFNILVLIFLVFVVIPPIFPVLQNALKKRKLNNLAARSKPTSRQVNSAKR